MMYFYMKQVILCVISMRKEKRNENTSRYWFTVSPKNDGNFAQSIYIVISLLTPVLYLVLFSPLLSKLTNLPGFWSRQFDE